MLDRDRVLILTKADIESVLTLEDTIEAVEEGFKAYNAGKAVVPFPVALQVPDHSGDIHIKPGYLRGTTTYCIKIASGFYENDKVGLPPSHGMLLLFDSSSGWPLCIEVDRGYVTDLRTAAAGAVAARALARDSIDSVAVIGTGTQARLQVEALMKVRKFTALKVWGRTPTKVWKYAEDMKRLGLKIIQARSVEEAVRGSDVVITTTMSTAPLVKAEWVEKGTHITAVGSDSPEKQELDPAVLKMADKVVVDSIRQCAALGELHHAIEVRMMAEDHVYAELGEILLGRKSGRESEGEITVCDLTGLAVQDVVTAQLVYERALKRNKGEYVKV